MNDRMLRSALKYATVFGWPVFPLAPRSKFPLKGSHGCKDATNDPDQIRKWWEQTPNANIGLACGVVNFCLDVDPRNGGDQSLETLEAKHGRLPDTIQQISGRGVGRHYVWTVPEGVEIRCGQIAPGLDIKGIGGYILLAPSIHPDSGKEYAWDGADELKNQKILPAPEWLMALVSRPAGAFGQEAREDAEIKALAQNLASCWPAEGKRHDAFLALAGACAHTELPLEDAQMLVEALYREIWPSDPWLIEARREVKDTYDTLAGGGKVTGFPKLRQLGAERTALRVAQIWMQKRNLASEDRKADATASMSREQRLANLNKEPIFALAQPGLEWKAFRWIGQTLEGITSTGEYVRFESAKERRRPREAFERIEEDLRISILPRATTRDKTLDWLRIMRDMTILADDDRWTRRNKPLQRDVLDLLRYAFDAANTPRFKTLDERHEAHKALLTYRRSALPDMVAPPCVYVWESLVYVHTSTLRRWSSQPSGDSRNWMLGDLEDALIQCEFRYNDRIQIVRDGYRTRIRLMSGPLSAIDESIDASDDDDDDV